MCTRGVWQLTDVTLRYCRVGGNSEATRQYIKERLVAYAAANPTAAIATDHAPNKHPVAIGRYRSFLFCRCC